MLRRLLITGGASWVKLDAVRVLANVFTGNTAVFLAKVLSAKGHRVTLLINPERAEGLAELAKVNPAPRAKARGFTGGGVKVETYRWHDEFIKKLARLLRAENFDCVIHAAALADFCPERVFYGKMSSRQGWIIRLKPAPKALPLVRQLCKGKLVQFKLEVNKGKRALVDSAYRSLKENKSDFVIANSYRTAGSRGIRGYLIDRQKKVIPILSQKAMPGIIEKYVLGGRSRC